MDERTQRYLSAVWLVNKVRMENREMETDIDIVVAWVDGSDPEWVKLKQQYSNSNDDNVDERVSRYRNLDIFRYWFRGIEAFAPWVHRIHFVTWGHVPKWLNVNHEKLNIVRHTDFIPRKYLPTFSSHPIELNFHRIPELSEQFIYFNDDMFLIKKTLKHDFFVNGKPCDAGILAPHCYDEDEMWVLTPFVNIGVINKHFDMKTVIKRNKSLWFNSRYGKFNLTNLILSNCPRFPGIKQDHLPTSFLKKTFTEVWSFEEKSLDTTCQHKFREKLDINQWLFKEWQIVEGNFCPRSPKIGNSFGFISEPIQDVCSYIEKQKGKMICINDNDIPEERFHVYSKMLVDSFDKILEKKSSFEW